MSAKRLWSRRRFSVRLAAAAAAGAGWLASVRQTRALQQERLQVDLSAAEYEPLRKVGGAVKVPVADSFDPAIVVRIDEDRFKAFSSACTHLGCEVELPDEQGIIICQCHGARYDFEGRLLDGPADRDLPEIPLAVQSATAVENKSWGQIKRRY